MEDFKFNDSSNVGPISSVDFTVSTSSQQSFFNTPSSVSDLVSNYQSALTMQDDPLNENSSHTNTQNSCQQNTENGNDDQVNVSQTKDDGISMVNLGNGVQTDSPEQRDVSGITNNQLPAYSASEPSLNVINSINSSNLWANNVDDNMLHNFNVSSTNGALTFQNFSPSENALYEPTLGNHISGLTSPQIQSQRRTVSSQNYPHNITRNLSQTNPQQNVYLANKMFNNTWNTSQSTWGPSMQNQNNVNNMSAWNRGRSTPNLNPMQNLSNRKLSPSFSQQQNMLMAQKFRRSTSYPGKNVFSQGSAYDINHVDDSSDLILPYQYLLIQSIKMAQLTDAEIQAAMDQISNSVVSVTLHRLTSYEIEEMTRPKKRRVKRRYTSLDFNDDNEYFEKACSHESWYPERKRRRRKKVEEKEEKREKEPTPWYFSSSDDDSRFDVKPSFNFEIEDSISVKEERSTSSSSASSDPFGAACPRNVKEELASGNQRNKTAFACKIRVKSAAELGSTIVFVDVPDGCQLNSCRSADSPRNVLSDLISCEVEGGAAGRPPDRGCGGGLSSTPFNIHVISNLYKKFFTKENRKIIGTVAEVLHSLSANIKRKNDKLSEITNSRCTDAEKLMLRHQAHGEFNRVKESNQAILKKQLDTISKIFSLDHFEILFQLFFLGILKLCIGSLANKKGTIFKKIVSLLSQSLSGCDYQNERVTNMLKSKNFRTDCIALVHFIEKYSETKFFDLLFISEAEKAKIMKHTKNSAADAANIALSKCRFASSSSETPSIVKYATGMRVLPVGNHLLLPGARSAASGESSPAYESKAQFSRHTKASPCSYGGKSLPKFAAAVAGGNSSKNSSIYAPKYQIISKAGHGSSKLVPNADPSSAATKALYSMPVPVPANVNSSASTATAAALGSTMLSTISSATPFSTQNITANGGHIAFSPHLPLPGYHVIASANGPNTSYTGYNSMSQNTLASSAALCIPSASLSTAVPSSSTAAVNSSSSALSYQLHSTNLLGTAAAPPTLTPNAIVAASSSSVPVAAAAAPTSSSIMRTHSVIVGSSAAAISSHNVISATPTFNTAGGGSVSTIFSHAGVLPAVTQNSGGLHHLQTLLSSPASLVVQPPLQETSGIEASGAVGREYQPQNAAAGGLNLCTADADGRTDSVLRTYGAAKDANRKVTPTLPMYGQSGAVPKFYPTVSAVSSTGAFGIGAEFLSTSAAAAPFQTAPHFINTPIGGGGASCGTQESLPRTDTGPINHGYSSYRTSSPAANNENIQPCVSPLDNHILNPNNIGDGNNSRLKEHNYSNFSRMNGNDRLTLRSLLSENECVSALNQNSPSDMVHSYAEKANYMPDLSTTISSNSVLGDSLMVSNHIPIASYVGNTFPC